MVESEGGQTWIIEEVDGSISDPTLDKLLRNREYFGDVLVHPQDNGDGIKFFTKMKNHPRLDEFLEVQATSVLDHFGQEPAICMKFVDKLLSKLYDGLTCDEITDIIAASNNRKSARST